MPGTIERRRAAILMAIGAALRIAAYLSDRSYWMDEQSLRANILAGPTFALSGRLVQWQTVPPLFLLVERVVLRLLGDHRHALRIVPLLGGLASLPLMDAVSRRILPGGAVFIAIALFAVSDEQIYFSTELKPYATDVTAALAVLLVALEVRSRGLTARLSFALLAVGAVLPWFSFPAIFVLASCGLVLAFEAIAARRWRYLAALTAIGATWLASFAGSWLATRSQIGPDLGLWAFWDFAFPPSLATDPFWVPRRFLFYFVSPLDFGGPWPLDPRLAALPAIACFLIGLGGMLVRQPAPLALLLGPGALAVLAASLHLYPFHGRLILFLAPSFLLLIASGADLIRTLSGRRAVGLLLLLALLANSALLDLRHLTWDDRSRDGLNPHGDRRPERMTPDMFRLGGGVSRPARMRAEAGPD